MSRRHLHADDHDRFNEPGWSGYRSSTSQFVEKCHPRFVKTERERSRDPGKVAVYFVRFTSIEVPTYSFLKICISNATNIRFDFDSHRFKHAVLAQIKGLTRERAIRIEAQILEKFALHKHTPRMALMSKGNSEFLEDSKELQEEIRADFRARGGKNVQPPPEIDLRIHNLMLLLNFADACGIETEIEKIIVAFRGQLKGLGVKVPSKDDLMVHFRRKIRPKLR